MHPSRSNALYRQTEAKVSRNFCYQDSWRVAKRKSTRSSANYRGEYGRNTHVCFLDISLHYTQTRTRGYIRRPMIVGKLAIVEPSNISLYYFNLGFYQK